MTDRQAPKTDAERMREYRKRAKARSVDNPDSRNDFVTQNVTILVTLVTEIVTIVTEIRDALIVITPPPGPSAPTEEEGPVTRYETPLRVTRNGARDRDVIDACGLCDDHGFIGYRGEDGISFEVKICDHVKPTPARRDLT